MNFILPKNYKFKPKLFGLLDYQTALLNGLWGGILFGFVNLFFSALSTKVYLFISAFVPFLLFSMIGIHNENLVSIFFYVLKYYKNQKLYLFKKNYSSIKNK